MVTPHVTVDISPRAQYHLWHKNVAKFGTDRSNTFQRLIRRYPFEASIYPDLDWNWAGIYALVSLTYVSSPI